MSDAIRLIAAIAALSPLLLAGDQPRVLFYPSVLKSGKNMLEGAKWRPPGEKSEKDSRAARLKGGPFSVDEPAYEVESFAPESAYWRTHAKVLKGHTYLVGAWVKFSNAKILFWCNAKRIDGKPSDQRLYCFSGFQSYLTPYFSETVRNRLGGNPDEWRLMFRTLEYPEPVVNDSVTIAMGLYMATGKMVFSAPFLLDTADGTPCLVAQSHNCWQILFLVLANLHKSPLQ